VEQPLNFKPGPDGDAAVATLAAYQPDVLLVAAYGLILPQRVLDIPKYMPINVHGSLLPKYRGAAPVQRAIMNGDAVTGVTIMRMEAGLDSGPMLRQRAVGIGLQDTSGTLMDELAREGAELLLESLERLSSGLLAAIPQDESRATYAAKLTKAEAWVDPRLSARALHAHIRALSPWPGARLLLRREGKEDMPVLVEPGEFPLKPESRAALEGLTRTNAVEGESVSDRGAAPCPAGGNDFPQTPSTGSLLLTNAAPGGILGLHGEALLMVCGDGAYAFTALRPAGKKSMDGKAFFNGYLAAHPEAAFVLHTEQGDV
jgi:methionyl-tRNA formyltransferase